MNRKPSRVGAEFANEYLGHEETIVMNVEDARYRYYQWLRGWYGMGKREDTNKCPFYQFMFWGSLLMLASIVPIIIMKIIDIFVLWPLSWVAPGFVDQFNATAAKSKMMFSWVITAVLLLVGLLISAIISFNFLAWFGLVVHFIYAIPYILLAGTWLGIVFLFTEAIPWIFSGIVFVLEAIFAFLIAFINIPWLNVLLWTMIALAAIVGTATMLIVLYKLAVWFFKSSFTAFIIRKSCDMRDFRIRKHKEHKVKVHELKKKKLELKKLEPKKVEKAWKEPNEKWNEILMAAFDLIWAGLKIFPGYPLKLLGYGFKWVFKGITIAALGLQWIAEKIWDVIVVIWSLTTETVSNHCPPIDFVVEISETGELNRRSDTRFRFTSANLKEGININTTDLPDNFKTRQVGDRRRATIRCTVRSSELEMAKIYRHTYGRDSADVDVYKIQDLKYLSGRVVRKK